MTFLRGRQRRSRSRICFLRSAERILLKVGCGACGRHLRSSLSGRRHCHGRTICRSDAKFWVTKATSVKSKLFSPSDIQSIVKKAIVERLKGDLWDELVPGGRGELSDSGIVYMKDEAVIGLDTTGESLHKRGYRKLTSKAPITETLAAALIMLTPWKADRILVDPFCGSGTFPIEAAMMAANIAPGMNRSFLAENWKNLVAAQALVRCGGGGAGSGG